MCPANGSMKLRNWLAVLILIIVFLLQPVWSQTATAILNEGFESGNLNGWQTSGLLFVSSLRPHTGNFSVILGVDETLVKASKSDIFPQPVSEHEGTFMLSRSLAVTPQSNLTVKFWYSSWNPYFTSDSRAVMQYADIRLRCALQEGNVIIGSQSFGEQDFLNSTGGSTPWKEATIRLTIPSGLQTVTLNFTGKSGWTQVYGVGVIIIDDIEANLLPQSVPELTATPIVAIMVLIISFSVLNYHKKLHPTQLIQK